MSFATHHNSLHRNDEYLAKQGLVVKDVVDSLDFIE